MQLLRSFILSLAGLSATLVHALEPWQGSEVPVEAWRCGAPLVLAMRSEPALNDPQGRLGLKASLERLSSANLARWRATLGTLSVQEKALVDSMDGRRLVPLVHRSSVDTSGLLLSRRLPLSSPAKRGARPAVTPGLEDALFGGFDCVFASAGLPYGIVNYGPVIWRLKDQEGFAWGAVYTGYTWLTELQRQPVTATITPAMKKEFARMVVTNNHFQESLALQIIGHVRRGDSIRNLGARYDRTTILAELLATADETDFWKKVVTHRLAFLEAHYVDDVPQDDVRFVQFREMDRAAVAGLSLPAAWFQGDSRAFVQFFRRAE